MDNDTTQAPTGELTAEQRNGLIEAIAAAYPMYRVWWLAGTWYATRPPLKGVGSRTLHGEHAGALVEQLSDLYVGPQVAG